MVIALVVVLAAVVVLVLVLLVHVSTLGDDPKAPDWLVIRVYNLERNLLDQFKTEFRLKNHSEYIKQMLADMELLYKFLGVEIKEQKLERKFVKRGKDVK